MLFFAVPDTLFSAEKTHIEVTAKVDKDQVNIGDKIRLDIILKNSAGYEVSFPEIPGQLGEFSLLEFSSVKSSKIKAQAKAHEYVLTIYTAGRHKIPPIHVKYKKPEENEWHIDKSPQVAVEVKSLLTGEDEDIKPLKDLAVFGTGPLSVVFILLLVAGIVVVSWFLWRRRKRIALEEVVPVKSAYEIAYEELSKLKEMDLPGKGQIKEYYIRLSDIARHYLENRFSFRAPEMTTEEFMQLVKESAVLLEEHKRLLKDFLSHCDMVKFAKYGPTPLEMLDSFHAAEQLIDQTRIKQHQEQEECV